jgi:hypothetical protein
MKHTDAVGTAGGKATVETTVETPRALTVERMQLADMQAVRLEPSVPVSALRALLADLTCQRDALTEHPHSWREPLHYLIERLTTLCDQTEHP